MPQRVRHIAYLERIIEDDRRSRELDEDPAMGAPFTKTELINRSLIALSEAESRGG